MNDNSSDRFPLFEPWKVPYLGTPQFASVILAALLVSSMLAPMLTEGGNGELSGGGSLVRQSIYLLLFALTLANSRSREIFSLLTVVPVGIGLVLAWSLISMLWAINPAVAIRRLTLTALIIYDVFLLVSQCGSTRVVETSRSVFGLVIIANYAAVFLAPGWAIHQSATEEDPSIIGSWKGVLGQKNAAGAICAISVLFFLLYSPARGTLYKWCTILASIYFLYRTNSKTSIALLVTSLVIVGAYKLYNPFYNLIFKLATSISICVAALLLIENWDVVAAPFLREDFLTGRGQIWVILMRYSRDHLFLGTGFGSFWNVGEVSPVLKYTNGWVSQISSGHNGFLDLLTQIGLPGLLLVFWGIFLKPFSTLMATPIDKRAGGLIVGCIWFCVWHNLTESSVFNRDEAVETFLMLGIALLGLEAKVALPDPRRSLRLK